MLTLPAIVALLNQRKNRVLRIAEAALPETQFRAFRGLVLDELGREGLERDLERLAAEREAEGEGQANPCKGRRCP